MGDGALGDSEAKGEMDEVRGAVGAEERAGTGAARPLPMGMGRLAARPLSNCSTGSRRCAWMSFSMPSSR